MANRLAGSHAVRSKLGRKGEMSSKDEVSERLTAFESQQIRGLRRAMIQKGEYASSRARGFLNRRGAEVRASSRSFCL